MNSLFSDIPLAVFTTLVPVAVGVFIPYALLCSETGYEEKSIKAFSRIPAASAVIFLVGLVAASFHLGNPGNALNTMNGIGHSPLSNEAAISCLYFVMVIVAAIGSSRKGCSVRFRKVMMVLVLAFGFLLAVFTGLAYCMKAVVSWTTPWASIEQTGFVLMGAVVGAAFMEALSPGSLSELYATVFHLVALGFVISAAAMIAHMVQVSGMSGVTLSGTELIPTAIPYMVSSIACLAVSVTASYMAVSKKRKKSCYAISTFALLAGVFLCRLAFYSLQLNIGA